jgi:hypothetical protein
MATAGWCLYSRHFIICPCSPILGRKEFLVGRGRQVVTDNDVHCMDCSGSSGGQSRQVSLMHSQTPNVPMKFSHGNAIFPWKCNFPKFIAEN